MDRVAAQFIETILAIDRRLKSPNQTSSFKMQTDAISSLYNSHQSLIQYFPEIHHRINVEDFMAKQTNDWNLIEYRLEDAEIEAFESWASREKLTPVAALNYCAEKEYKVSLSFSEHNSSWCASITGKKDARFNSGSTLTSWSDDPIEALYMAVFKASVIFEHGIWKTRKSASRG